MGIKIFFFHYYERKKKVLERYFFLTTYISKVFPETFKCISLRQVVFRSNLQMHSIFILTSNLKQIYRLLKLTVTCCCFFCCFLFVLLFFFDKYLFIYKSFSYKSKPQVTIAKFIQMRKTNPITRIKRGKGVLVKFYSSNRVSLLYFESQSRVSLRKHSHGFLTVDIPEKYRYRFKF